MQVPSKRFSAIALGIAAAFAVPHAAQASGFALVEQSGSGMGNAYAGSAAAAEDASTIYFNPAGMSFLPAGKQIAGALHYIRPKASFNNSASVPATLAAFGAPSPTGNGGNAGEAAFVPNGYFSMDLTPQVKFGVGVNVPFGLATDYSDDFIGRFQALRSEVKTININPALSFKVNDTVSLGFGLNYQSIDATLTNKVNYVGALFVGGGAALIPATVAAGQAEGKVTLKADDTGWGWNAGAMFKLSNATRLGVAYRSRIKYTVKGTAVFDNRPAALAAAIPNGDVKLDLKVPDNLSFALSHALDNRWQILADATWTGWKVLQKFEVVRTSGAILNSLPFNWRNTWRVGVGANYKLNDAWTLKGGLAYDQTPTNDIDRGARLPDANRTWLSFGGKYAISKATTLDLGYAHLFIKNSPINTNIAGNNTPNTAAVGLINGSYKASTDILSAQITYLF